MIDRRGKVKFGCHAKARVEVAALDQGPQGSAVGNVRVTGVSAMERVSRLAAWRSAAETEVEGGDSRERPAP
jgi:hypothetical protein